MIQRFDQNVLHLSITFSVRSVLCTHTFSLFSLSSVPDHDGCHSLHLQIADLDIDGSGNHWLHR